MAITLVLGGARSGKSRFAQQAAEKAASPLSVRLTMIVTAQVYDAEMAERVARHQADRDDRWQTLEAPLALADAIRQQDEGDVAVIDCMTLWLTNVMLAERDIEAETQELIDALKATKATVWIVSNEVGWGIVPDNALARRFRDAAGRLNQQLAATCDETYLVAAGLKLKMEPF